MGEPLTWVSLRYIFSALRNLWIRSGHQSQHSCSPYFRNYPSFFPQLGKIDRKGQCAMFLCSWLILIRTPSGCSALAVGWLGSWFLRRGHHLGTRCEHSLDANRCCLYEWISSNTLQLPRGKGKQRKHNLKSRRRVRITLFYFFCCQDGIFCGIMFWTLAIDTHIYCAFPNYRNNINSF